MEGSWENYIKQKKTIYLKKAKQCKEDRTCGNEKSAERVNLEKGGKTRQGALKKIPNGEKEIKQKRLIKPERSKSIEKKGSTRRGG